MRKADRVAIVDENAGSDQLIDSIATGVLEQRSRRTHRRRRQQSGCSRTLRETVESGGDEHAKVVRHR